MGPKTRHESGTSVAGIVGVGEEMPITELPTLRMVLRHGIYLQEKALLEEDIDRRNFPIKDMAVILREQIESRYVRANALFSPPIIIAHSSIERKIQVAWTALTDIARERGSMKKKEDRTKFLEKLDFLFPITSCTHKVIPCLEETLS